MHEKAKISFNSKVAKRLSKDEFVKQHSDNDHVSDEDAGAYWESVNEKPDDKPAKEAKAK